MSLTKKSSYYYNLPQDLIAQKPLEKRDDCRLLHIVRNSSAEYHHRKFRDILSLLKQTDVLVINVSKVIPARLIGKKHTGAKIEVLLLKETTTQPSVSWECLTKPANKLKVDDKIDFYDEQGLPVLTGKIVGCGNEGIREIEFNWDGRQQTNQFLEIIEKIGQVPLPPYIKRVPEQQDNLQDKEYYQTVYADTPGSAAAPTAGMHFTDEMMETIAQKGVQIVPIILHIGIDTFRPVSVDDILDHKMHTEFCTIPEESACIINQAKKQGSRIIAVGTTVTRTLESFAVDSSASYNDNNNKTGSRYSLGYGSKWSDLFIYPSYEFKIIDGLLTNFHLPESTLLMLVSAFSGYETIMKAYQEAVDKEYRFFSYGDAMLIV